MDLIRRICEKYPIDYFMKPSPGIQSVDLSFGQGIDGKLKEDVLEGLDRLGVFTDVGGLPLSIELFGEASDEYTLSAGGQELFRFSGYFAERYFENYDICEALIWAIYIIASRQDWLDEYKGRGLYLSCRCFSARQQAAAGRISRSLERQYQGSVSEEQYSAVFKGLLAHISGLSKQAPRFSSRPISAAVFANHRGSRMDAQLKSVAGALFGEDFLEEFEREQEAFFHLVTESEAYRKRVAEAVDLVTEEAYSLPIMAVKSLFTELTAMTDELEQSICRDFTPLLKGMLSFTLTADNLKSSFRELDEAFINNAGLRLEATFARTVCEMASARIDRELKLSRRSIMQLRNAMSRFCFIRGEDESPILSWKQLVELQEWDISSKTQAWTTDTVDNLQCVIKSVYSPHLWLCSERLYNLSERDSVSDALLMRAVPLLDEQLIWAIWIDRKGCGNYA